MATHSSIPNWEVPWTEEPCRLSPWSLKESDTTERLTQVCVLKQLNSFSLSPYPLVTTILFCFMSLAFLDPRVSHTVFVFLNLTSHLAPYSPGTVARFHFLWLSSNPHVCIRACLCVYTHRPHLFCPFILLSMDTQVVSIS